ncbi:MAG: hypothetical protein KGL39_24030 [Patescibacteria group bacterium]|nr:hypothetical protein [Patescibacteria group bacterium]
MEQQPVIQAYGIRDALFVLKRSDSKQNRKIPEMHPRDGVITDKSIQLTVEETTEFAWRGIVGIGKEADELVDKLKNIYSTPFGSMFATLLLSSLASSTQKA